jgi:ABC-type sugar transport system ATPase subunit
VRVRGLTKAYAGVTVLHDVDLRSRGRGARAARGERRGKSTLIKILSGVVRADAGTVEVDGRPVEITTPRSATDQGIATLHQELAIVPGLSVAENVLLGQRPPQAGGRVRWRELERRARELLAEVGQSLDVRRTPAGSPPSAAP